MASSRLSRSAAADSQPRLREEVEMPLLAPDTAPLLPDTAPPPSDTAPPSSYTALSPVTQSSLETALLTPDSAGDPLTGTFNADTAAGCSSSAGVTVDDGEILDVSPLTEIKVDFATTWRVRGEDDHELHEDDHKDDHEDDHELHEDDHELHEDDHELHEDDHELHEDDHELHEDDHKDDHEDDDEGLFLDEDIQNKLTALHDAIDGDDLAEVRRLLAEGAHIVHCEFWLDLLPYSFSFLHLTDTRPSTSTRLEIIKEIIAAAAQANNKGEIFGGRSYLDGAIRGGHLEIIEALVNAGTDIHEIGEMGETILHVAVTQPRILKYFLDNHNIQYSPEMNGYFPIHKAAAAGNLESIKLLLKKFGPEQLIWRSNYGRTVWHKIAVYNRVQVAEYLLQPEFNKYRFVLNLVHNGGLTPVCISAREGNLDMTALLLRNGAVLSAKGQVISVVEQISAKFNNPSTFFREIFDECIYEKGDRVNVNYKILADDRETTQIKVMEELVECRQSKLLKHPMIESLIYLKWKCLLPVFYVIIATYAIFLGTFNVFVITTFNRIDSNNGTPCNATADAPCVESCGWLHWTLVALIYISIGVLITEECIWIYLQRLRYFKLAETWVKLGVFLLASAMPILLGCNSSPDDMRWARHLACAALLLAWLQAMLLLSRFPGWGYYVLMFERVAINILKILVTSIFLVFAFSTCFMIQYRSKTPFDGPGAAFIKTLVMMSSEFDYGDLFDEDHDELTDTRAVVRVLFVMFVIFIAIVLMNFMIGVAVSDINELNTIGNIRRLEKQVELLGTLEALVDTALVKWWKRLSRIRYHTAMYKLMTEPGRKWFVLSKRYNVHPDDFSDICSRNAVTPELHNAIIDFARKKNPHVVQDTQTSELDAQYDAVVGQDLTILNKRASNQSTDKLEDKIRSIEDAIKEIRQSIDDSKKDLRDINEKLTLLTNGMNLSKSVE